MRTSLSLIIIFSFIFIFNANSQVMRTTNYHYSDPSTAQSCFGPSGPSYQFPNNNNWRQPFSNPYFYPSVTPTYPWWASQGAMMYPNFYYPGPWHNRGVDGDHYPGQGDVHILKPNIYLTGPKNEKVNVKIITQEDHQLIATAPLYPQSGWDLSLHPKNKLKVDNTIYDYLFYDVRLDKSQMQLSKGFCVAQRALLHTMNKWLELLNYNKAERKDFDSHWQVKIPSYPYYCVFPQTDKELNKAIPLKITPDNIDLTRIWFLVVPFVQDPALIQSHKFVPQKEYTIPQKEIKSTIQVREWGVGFLDSKLMEDS